MKWLAKNPNRWRNRFAFLPVRIGDEMVWWEWYKARPNGFFTEVAMATEWPNCCDEMLGEMWIDGQHIPEHCPVHSPPPETWDAA